MRTSVLLSIFFAAQELLATQFGISSNIALMQQPSSQYYHLMYGASASVQSDKRDFAARYQFSERPVFSSAGFSEQEQAQFLLLGGLVKTLARSTEVSAFLGPGQVRGYIKPSSPETETLYDRRGYRLNGIALDLELAAYFGRFKIALNHQTFVGISSREELKAYVAWPYAFYGLALGCLI